MVNYAFFCTRPVTPASSIDDKLPIFFTQENAILSLLSQVSFLCSRSTCCLSSQMIWLANSKWLFSACILLQRSLLLFQAWRRTYMLESLSVLLLSVLKTKTKQLNQAKPTTKTKQPNFLILQILPTCSSGSTPTFLDRVIYVS